MFSFLFFFPFVFVVACSKRKNNEVGVDMKEDLGGVGEGKGHDQNILQKIPKYQITTLKEEKNS